MRTNRKPGPVNTNWGDKFGICKLRPRGEPVNTNLSKHKVGARAGKSKFCVTAGKHKVGARAGKYKLEARAGSQSQGQGPSKRPGAGKHKHPKIFPIFHSALCDNNTYCLTLTYYSSSE